jgi:hypothetical protein
MGRSVEAAQPIHPLGSFSLSILPFYSSPLLQVFSFRSPRSSRSIVLSFYLSRSAVRGLSSFHASIQSCNHAFFWSLFLSLIFNLVSCFLILYRSISSNVYLGTAPSRVATKAPSAFANRAVFSREAFPIICMTRPARNASPQPVVSTT